MGKILGMIGPRAKKKAWRYLGLLLIGIANWAMILGCEKVSKPEIRNPGPLQIEVPAGAAVPEYHVPAEKWRVVHGRAINLRDFSEKECILCHNPQTGCQKCHRYVGGKEIKLAEALILWGSRERDGR